MIRKTLKLLSLLLCLLATSAAWATDWHKYVVYADNVDDVVETSDKVYYLSGGNLFSFSEKDNSAYAYNSINKLNDNDISALYYNYEKKYLLLVYSDSNLDVILEDGTVVNMPDIKDASVSSSKAINHVTFGEGRIVIATDFGFVMYNDTRFEVEESGIYGSSLRSAFIMDGYLVIHGDATGHKAMYSPLEMRHNNLDKFTPISVIGAFDTQPISDTHIVTRAGGTNTLYIGKIDFAASTLRFETLPAELAYDAPVRRCAEGFYTQTASQIVTIHTDGTYSLMPLPEAIHGQLYSYLQTPTSLWAANEDGVAKYDISSGTPTVIYEKFIFNEYITDQRVGYMRWSPDNKRLYISNYETSKFRSYAMREGSENYQTTNIIEKNDIIDASLKNASAEHGYNTQYQAKFGNKRMYGDPTWIVEDPDDPDKYYCGNYFEGIYVIKRNAATGEYEEVGKYTADNSNITDNWGERVVYVDIDKEGNLWVGYQYGNHISILPADKRKLDPAQVKASDWKAYTMLSDFHKSEVESAKDFMAVICKKSNMVFYAFGGTYQNGFVAIDTKGTYADPSDDTVVHWPRVTDQDGNDIMFERITFFIEDQRGCVWVGTSSAGVFEITNPSDATNYNMHVRRIKVPRNDGTNYADYLLDTDLINWMAVDPSDRKWIATESSGLFLVSETGDKIIRSFDKSNSPLPSNSVCTVECDRADNTVYVGTTNGLYTFQSDAAPTVEDYSEILAYPNPVRPEYSGLVNISGLMDHSVVKITDTAGNVVYETRSEGGMASWDACDKSGQRVKSGVYYVFASQNNSGESSTGAATKILVIN